jgi:hypothetical protein
MSHLDGTDFDKIFEEQQTRIQLFSEVATFCNLAYEYDNPYCMSVIQKILFKIYSLHVNIPVPGSKTAESSFILHGVRNLIEKHFLEYEDKQISPSIWQDIPVESHKYTEWLLEIIHNHPAYKHPLYEDYLNKYATLDDLRYFLVQETTIDTRFDDFLALIQLGTDGGIKLEIASNYWDEMGNGDESRMHTVMFSRTMVNLGIDTTGYSDDLTPEALICGNLSLMLSLRRKYFYKAIGYFAATEYMTPRRFKNLLTAWQRNGLKLSDAEYHKEHIRIDAIHANDWLKNVISPLIDKNPDTVFEITRGVLYRLNTSKKYLDMLLSKFTRQQTRVA